MFTHLNFFCSTKICLSEVIWFSSLLTRKNEKINLYGRRYICQQDSEILGAFASREQIVNKTWINKQLIGMLVYWRLHMERFIVNKQLMIYSIIYRYYLELRLDWKWYIHLSAVFSFWLARPLPYFMRRLWLWQMAQPSYENMP